ncbi:MAG: FHA domain-containing protein [Deltaproteobacteria bacterium]|nr:FHA domain-containing protein [Deltaproteobacteria bacterium]
MVEARVRVRAGAQIAEVGSAELIIGRSLYCSMLLDHISVSRVHASLRRVGDRCALTDLGSRNGTRVNGQRIGKDPVLVGPEDRIEVGDVQLVLEFVLVSHRREVQTRGATSIVPSEADPEDTTGVGLRKDEEKPGG